MKSIRRWAPLGFMGRLARDKGGNTLAIMAAMLIPLAGMVGGGIDISRMYITKTRLQHACDAGALAGRKAMGGGTWARAVNGVSNYPNATAEKFFDANFQADAYGMTVTTPAQLRSFSENAGKVTGTATAVLPMSLMKIFGIPTQTLVVNCATEMRLPNTDIMFVLDTTGSMGSKAVSTDSDTKIESLKTAVKCFYEIVARLDTDATCSTGTPSGGTGSQTQIRFGFMPYSTNVNVGKLLPTSFFADSWNYQTREPQYTETTTYTYPAYSDSTAPSSTSTTPWSAYNDDGYTNLGTTRPTCTAPATTSSSTTSSSDSPVTTSGGTKTYTTTTTVTTTYKRWTSTLQSGVYNRQTYYYCQLQSSTRTETVTTVVTHTSRGVPTVTRTFDKWHYGSIATNVAGIKTTRSITLPIGSQGADRTITWDGCIEERRPTVQQATYDPLPTAAKDLDIDLMPNASDASTLWGPALDDLIYARNITSNYNQAATADAYTTDNYYNGLSYYCPTEAKKLQAWTDATVFDTYVDSLTPSGNTYHDIGMLWGARFLSPTGIFKDENALTSGGGEIQRHLIFMTDGDAQSAPCDYTAYGVAWWDQRTTTNVGTASNCPYDRQELDDQINARLVGLCTAVKNKNIILWVISFGSGSNTATETRLSNCASPGRYFTARNSDALQTTFASIANQISQLRLVQ